MIRKLMAVGFAALIAGPGPAQTQAQKEAECAFQAGLIGAVQSARLARWDKDEVPARLMQMNPTWPAGVADALPALTDYVYGLRMRDLRQNDLKEATRETCLTNYDQIQRMKNTVDN
jgi:hypothetical protein